MNVKVKKHLIIFSPNIFSSIGMEGVGFFYFLLLFSIIMPDSWSRGVIIIITHGIE